MFKSVYKTIKKYDEIVIARHIGPDPDAIASQIALRDSIRETFPNKKVLAVGVGVSRFKCYGYLDKLNESGLNNPLLIVLDTPNICRIDGINFDIYKEVIKIDHHPFEDEMGIEIIDDEASSTCQIVAELLFNTKLKITKNIAENLYMGIVSDTDRFLFDYTSVKTFEIATKLIKDYDLQIVTLYRNLYTRSLNDFRFKGYISDNLILSKNGLAYIIIPQEKFDEYNVDSATASNTINDFNYIKEYIVWMFITKDEKNDLYKVNIRSRGPIINEIASNYNGGGHKFASGARIKLMDDVNKLINDLDEACKDYNEHNED